MTDAELDARLDSLSEADLLQMARGEANLLTWGRTVALRARMAKDLLGSRVAIKLLEEEAARLKAENERLRDAMEKIARYEEGPEVTSAFDEPASARIAREALVPPARGCEP